MGSSEIIFFNYCNFAVFKDFNFTFVSNLCIDQLLWNGKYLWGVGFYPCELHRIDTFSNFELVTLSLNYSLFGQLNEIAFDNSFLFFKADGSLYSIPKENFTEENIVKIQLDFDANPGVMYQWNNSVILRYILVAV